MKVVKPLVCVTWHYVTALPYCVSIRTSYLIMTKWLPSVEGPCWLPPHLHRVFIPFVAQRLVLLPTLPLSLWSEVFLVPPLLPLPLEYQLHRAGVLSSHSLASTWDLT